MHANKFLTLLYSLEDAEFLKRICEEDDPARLQEELTKNPQLKYAITEDLIGYVSMTEDLQHKDELEDMLESARK
jgi:hypothetical protein